MKSRFKDSYEVKSDHSLVLKSPIQKSVNGTYRCRFVNNDLSNEDYSLTNVIVRIPPSTPVLTKVSSNKLKCELSKFDRSEPRANFKWYFKNQLLDQYKMELWGIQIEGKHNEFLSIPEFDTSKNVGVYKCQAKNEVGTKFSNDEFDMSSALFGHIVIALTSAMSILIFFGFILYLIFSKMNRRSIAETVLNRPEVRAAIKYQKRKERIENNPFESRVAEATSLPDSPNF